TGERPVDPPERLDADEIAEYEHVERDLQLLLRLDLRGRMGVLPRLVVLHDPTGAERVDVDPVDLPGQGHSLRELEPALQLRRRALRAEQHLEATGNERRLGSG